MENKIRTQAHFNAYEGPKWHGGTIEIYPDVNDLFSSLTVYGQSEMGGREKVQINWSACGSQTPEVARAYAEAILKGVQIAGAWEEAIRENDLSILEATLTPITKKERESYWKKKEKEQAERYAERVKRAKKVVRRNR